MKIIVKNTSLVFQVGVPEVVPMTAKTSSRIYTQIFSKAEIENYKYWISNSETYEIILGFGDNPSLSDENFSLTYDWRAIIDWKDVPNVYKNYAYYRITCRRKDQGNLSPSNVTLYKEAISV